MFEYQLKKHLSTKNFIRRRHVFIEKTRFLGK